MVGANTHQATEASFLRKLRKPMVEKKRRDRMNVSIDNLKALLAKSSKNPASVVKMDKAEILELAVIHLTKFHQRPTSMETLHMTSYQAGFRACNKEAIRYLNHSAYVPNPLLQDLDSHLNNVSKTTSHQKTLSSASSLPRNHSTSSPILDIMPPMPRFGGFCGNSAFSPISSMELRGHLMNSPLDSASLSSQCRTPSPTPSLCSSSASNSFSGLSCDDTYSNISASADSMNEMVLGHIIKEDKLWRPW